MNGTPCSTSTDCALDIYDMEKLADGYATEPMVALALFLQQPDEEVLHTSFEQAISERVEALHERLSRLATSPLSDPLRERTTDVLGNTCPVMMVKSVIATPAPLRQLWRRGIVYCCLALIFTLLGFDLMGLLVMHMH